MITLMIVAFSIIQCSSSRDLNEQVSHEEIKGNIVNTLKYLDKMGIDSSEYLNNYEAEYFNEKFENYKKFNFSGEKVCFVGPGGLVFSNKQKYFNELTKYKSVKSDLHIFNESEKEESGGYIAAIFSSND